MVPTNSKALGRTQGDLAVARASNPEIVRQPLHIARTAWAATQEHR